MLGPAGSPAGAVRYGLRFRWAMSHDEIRGILFDEGGFDVRVVPGMTVPGDLDAQFSLHTKARIEGIRPEFPADTIVTPLAEPAPGHRLYRVRFARLGENRLTIVHDGGRETHLDQMKIWRSYDYPHVTMLYFHMYGYRFPGLENDGASGWQFMTAKFGRAWIRKDVPRGPWHYDGEIDLGYGAALRTAATIVADGPLFGLTAYGGAIETHGAQVSVVPRDGLRQRFAVVGQRGANGSAAAGARESSGASVGVFRLEVDRDGFAAEKPVSFDRELRRFTFTLENRTGDRHTTVLSFPPPGGADRWEVRADGRPVDLKPNASTDYPLRAGIPVGPGSARIEMTRR